MTVYRTGTGWTSVRPRVYRHGAHGSRIAAQAMGQSSWQRTGPAHVAYEYLMRQYGLQQVDVVLETRDATVFNFSRDSEQLVGVTSSVMLILLDSIFDHTMLGVPSK